MNSEDMSDTMKNLNNMINSNNIPDNLKEMLNKFSSQNNTASQTSDNSSNSINPEMISNMINMLNSGNSNNNNSDSNNARNDTNNSNNSSIPNIDIEMLMKMKGIMDKMNSGPEDPRSHLLLSLKPYLKESRRSKVDQYAKLFSMSKVIDIFNQTGGEKK